MLIRTISAFVAIPLFLVIVFVLPPYYLTVAIAAISAISVYELLWRSKIVKSKRLMPVAYLMSVLVPVWAHFGFESAFILPALFVLVLYAFVAWMTNQNEICFSEVCATIFGALILPLFLSTILPIAASKLLVLLPFVAAWLTDTGAYFTGVFFGKHKLAPSISPKKTIEGSIGGIIVCILSFLLYGFILEKFFAADANYIALAISGFFLSIIAQLGDLSMSIIKREYSIKDYGVIFPGHGGILDRFDSVLFTAPATLIVLQIVPLIF